VLGWLRNLTKPRKKPRKRAPKRQLAPVEDIVEQGIMVADVAVRMSVKNEIIMNALGRHVNYDEPEIIGLVKGTILRLADERQHDAENVAHMREEIRRRGRSRWTEAGYGNDDSSTLGHRQEVYERVSKLLREQAEDQDYLESAAEKARELAWNEIGNSLKDRAEHPYYSGGHTQEYQNARDDRIQQLISKDLTELVQQQRSAGHKEKKRRGFFGKERGDQEESN
jgi:hypothetical protein